MRLFGWFRPKLAREFDDPRRNAIVVTHHVKQQAGERYRCGDPWLIIGEVAEALRQGRVMAKVTTPLGVQRATRGAMLAWTADFKKIYVIYRRRRCWVVLTCLPTDETSAAAIAHRRAKQQRPAAVATMPRPRTSGGFHTHGEPAVGAALLAAQERAAQ